MTNSEKYIALLQELNRAFDFFNTLFCEGKLNKPFITVTSSKKSSLGHFWAEVWVDENGEQKQEEGAGQEVEKKKIVKENEINISADYLNKGADEVLHTLLHEMAHLKNYQEGIKDCNDQGRHNKDFKKAAEHFGLMVEQAGHKGWADTSLTSISQEAIEKFKPRREVFGFYRSIPKKTTENDNLTLLVSRSRLEDKINDLIDWTGEKKKELISQMIEEKWEYFNNSNEQD